MGAIKYIFQFIVLAGLQVLVLNNVEFFGYMNPYLYVLFLLTLPTNINRNLLLFIGFALGFTVDIFENSGAVHASATLFLAFIRPVLFRLVLGNASSDIERLNIKTIGLAKFMAMAAIAVFLHHFWLFMLEAFTFRELWQVLQRTVFSGIFSLLLIYIAQILVFRKKE